jgi:hypothetical protein
LSNEYSRALGRGVPLIGLVFALADGYSRLTAQITLMAILAYLGGVAVMVIRRPQAPTSNDLRLLRWGFLPLWFTAQVSARFVWSWRNLL